MLDKPADPPERVRHQWRQRRETGTQHMSGNCFHTFPDVRTTTYDENRRKNPTPERCFAESGTCTVVFCTALTGTKSFD